jgi:hypothetical protein
MCRAAVCLVLPVLGVQGLIVARVDATAQLKWQQAVQCWLHVETAENAVAVLAACVCCDGALAGKAAAV